MSNHSIFSFESYKAILRHRLRDSSERGALSRAAEALNCQRSFLSRVMNAEIHLTPDHAFLLSRHWKLSNLENDYFKTLVEMERASTVDYRNSLEAKLEQLRQTHLSLSEKLQRPSLLIEAHQQALYFSNWSWSAIHFLTSIPELQTTEAISVRLNLPHKIVLSQLEQLQVMGLVRKDKKKWIYNAGEFHLHRESPHVLTHHQNWRSRAAHSAQDTHGSGIHFTNIQTISKRDFEGARDLVLEFVGRCKELMDPSPPEEAVVITCDLFKP